MHPELEMNQQSLPLLQCQLQCQLRVGVGSHGVTQLSAPSHVPLVPTENVLLEVTALVRSQLAQISIIVNKKQQATTAVRIGMMRIQNVQ